MRTRESLSLLTLGALGVVYGDIGTSPLYALNETFFGGGGLSATSAHAIGAASLIVWLLLLIVGVKYIVLVLRAEHNGEGGVFALMSLLERLQSKRYPLIALLLMFSAGLLFGEGIITPAISVLSAVEGLRVLLPHLAPLIVPITIIILTVIFMLQKRGARTIGTLYGPIMFAWFLSIGGLGAYYLLQAPDVIFEILNPRSAITLFTTLTPQQLILLLGASFLVLTGSEALFADLGHFGKRAIRLGWVVVVLPALTLSYGRQAAYIVSGAPIREGNLFFSMVPEMLLVPMIVLATLATSIASVALIFGAYSIVSQAIVLNLLPRMRIIHTSARTEGQIYIPAVNWALYVGTVTLVLMFGTASSLASAYGFAVSGVMFITTIAMYEVARRHWGWSRTLSVVVFALLALLDLIFLVANSYKFFDGGYIPLALGCVIFAIILTWRWGRRVVHVAYDAYTASRDMKWFLEFKGRLERSNGRLCDQGRRCAVTLERTVVYLVSRMIAHREDKVPVKLRTYLKRRGAVPKYMVLLNIRQRHTPFVQERYRIVELGQGVVSVQATFGFMENPDAGMVIRELYRDKRIPGNFERCSVETSEDELIIENTVPWFVQLRARFYTLLLALSTPRYRYFGLMGEMATGLSKIVIPVRLSVHGVRVEIPEFSMEHDENDIDPDTHRESAVPYTPLP